MSDTNLVIVELNDTGLICHHRDGEILSPGYALLTKKGVTTGTEARARAWLHPQQSFNQYWHQLSMTPLSVTNSHARHHADLAYAQLQQLLQQLPQAASSTEVSRELIFSVPGNFSRQQLAILLGLAKACGHNATGLVDSALCAVAGSDKHRHTVNTDTLVHLDIQLHGAVLTTLACESGPDDSLQIRRKTVSPLAGIGLKSFEDSWVQAIANRFIEEYRYDPLHTAEGEQMLRNQLPGWLPSLQTSGEITVDLPTPSGELQLNIEHGSLVEAGRPALDTLTRATVKALTGHTGASAPPETCLFISHRVAALPGIIQRLPEALTLPADGAIRACLAHRKIITHRNGQVPLITALPLKNIDAHAARNLQSHSRAANPSPSSDCKPEASHVLYQHRAYAIGDGLILGAHPDGLDIQPIGTQAVAAENNSSANLCLLRGEQGLRLTAKDCSVTCDGNSKALKSGDTLTIDDGKEQTITLSLIEVL